MAASMPATRAEFPEKQARCSRPVAYHARGDGQTGGRHPSRRSRGRVAHRRRPRARDARPVHPPRHGALARVDRRRLPGVPLSRVALRRAGGACAFRNRPPPRFRPRRARRCTDARSATASSGCAWPRESRPTRCPRWPELDSGGWKVVNTGPFAWHSDASRQVENFTDFGHFPWVHPGLLGNPERPVVPDHKVETHGHVLHYTIVRPEAPNSDDFQVFANADTVAARAAQPLRAAPALHDRAAPEMGRREGHGLLLRLAARDARALPRLLHHRPQLRPRRPRQRRCRSSSA